MRYEWDEQKNEQNIAKHDVDFMDAPRIFLAPLLMTLDDRFEYGEERWSGLGLLEGRVVKIIYTEPDENTRRIISVRKAVAHERRLYEQFLKNQLGAL